MLLELFEAVYIVDAEVEGRAMLAVGVLYISFREVLGSPAGLGRQAYTKLEMLSLNGSVVPLT